MSTYRDFVVANERWFRGRTPETLESLRQAEVALDVTFPDDLKWVLSTYGYWHATGVGSLQDTVEKTLLARQHLQLPHQWIVLHDLDEGRVFMLDTLPHSATGDSLIAGLAWDDVPDGMLSDTVFPSLLHFAIHLIEVEGLFLAEEDIDYDPSLYNDSSPNGY